MAKMTETVEIKIDTTMAQELLKNLSIGVALKLRSLPRIISADGTQWIEGKCIDELIRHLES